jgi:hypothetical protein
LVASIFFAFFKVFFAIFVPPRLICPAKLHCCYMQRNRQTPRLATTLQKPRFLAHANHCPAETAHRSLVPVEIIIVSLKISTWLPAELPAHALRADPTRPMYREKCEGHEVRCRQGASNNKKGRQPCGGDPYVISTLAGEHANCLAKHTRELTTNLPSRRGVSLQRLGRMDLLGLLQCLLCHFVLPRLICPLGHLRS